MSAIWNAPDFDDHESVHVFRDASAGLTAIIAVHSTYLGPAGGGTRFWHYADDTTAMTDALRLSKGMSYKNAMAGLNMGGGKAVIVADAQKTKTHDMLTAFAKNVDSLAGRYVTAQDVGISYDDIEIIAKSTRHVAGLKPVPGKAGGDPGPSTALGVFYGIQAAVKKQLGTDDLSGVHVAIQGVGSVGGGVARHLAKLGARLTLADVNAEKARVLATELGASVVAADQILGIDADVLSPCALGAILNPVTIPNLKVQAIAGGANNQLATARDGDLLRDRGILYAPDYVINAGGIINVALQYLDQADVADVEEKLRGIPDRLNAIWNQAEASGLNPAQVADQMAMAMIGRA
jgi:leucine dehydrogenase